MDPRLDLFDWGDSVACLDAHLLPALLHPQGHEEQRHQEEVCLKEEEKEKVGLGIKTFKSTTRFVLSVYTMNTRQTKKNNDDKDDDDDVAVWIWL